MAYKKKKKYIRNKSIYALYKGENFIKEGTFKEIAEYIGVTETTVYFYSTKSYLKRHKKTSNNYKVLVLVEKRK